MPTQYQLTDQAIFSAAATGGVICSKVPAHGTDKIQIRRIDSSGRPVLQDLEGSAIKTAFGVDRFHWDGKTDMCAPLQKASFKNHGKDTTIGSKPTYKNITVSGMPDFTAPEPKSKPAASAAASSSASSAALTVSKRKFDRFTGDMTEGELAELQTHVRSSIAAKKAAKKSADGEKKKMQAKLQKMQADEAKLQAERAKLQAELEAMCTGAGAASTSPLASPLPASVTASPPKAPPLPTSATASPAKAPTPLHREPPDNNGIYTVFVSSRAAVAAHYVDVADEEPAKSWTASQMRSKLINDHYSEEQLRQLANGAGIHGSIKKADTLRTHLGKHFSAMLSA